MLAKLLKYAEWLFLLQKELIIILATLRDPLTVLQDDFGYFLPRDFESNFCLSSVQFFIAVAFSKGTIESLVFVQSQVSTKRLKWSQTLVLFEKGKPAKILSE